MNIEVALQQCRDRSAAFLDSQVAIINDARYWRHSATHDPKRDPAHLLYGTWSGVLASVSVGRARDLAPGVRRQIAQAINGFQRPDGTFMLPGLADGDRVGHDDEYLELHCTNYAVGALHALGEPQRYPLSFVERYRDEAALARWLASRDWSRPWTEGNNVVNVASFHALAAEDGDQVGAARLEQIAEWLEANQNPATGFWHTDDGSNHSDLWYAMAGAAHVLHVPYYLRRHVPNTDRIIDSCLRLGYPGIRSACLDIDLVDVLTHLRRAGHRVAEIDDVLERFLVELLQVQNPDGGFCDSYVTPHRMYGNLTPADASVMWTTWFRLATIGMVATTLLPSQRGKWQFRDTLGTGSFFEAYALAANLPASTFGRHTSATRRLLLAATRNGRFARQRATARVRGWIHSASGGK